MEKTDLRTLLNHIDPSQLSYQEWCSVGMALKEEGYTVADWEDWSMRDAGRYHKGECTRKWATFRGSASPVTGGTIFQMAVSQGWRPDHGYELDWDSVISADDTDGVVVDKHWVEARDVHEPKSWHPARELITYLETLFEPGECVGFVTQSWKNEKGKYIPKDKGQYRKTAGQIIEALEKCGDDIGSVVGDYNPEGGAWIRFNPLDGQGVRNENVSEFRYALVESDDMEIDRQNALLRELELPIAVLVHSGKKSLHAIVRIDAADYPEYRRRVDYLYEICGKNGMIIDTQNRNPSRLSRMPGCLRGEHKQFIVDTNIGKSSWNEWHDWIESVNDNLPDVDELANEWDHLPEIAPALIEGVLRQGHKMLIAGPSKAGKSFALIELCIAIAEGGRWLTWQCAKGRVLYVNLELDRASCLHRFKDVYDALGITPTALQNIDIWNLRGKTVPMDKLAPKLIRRAQKKDYKAIIIDPIYKVITGDENSADQMARFCNQFDMVCTELGCAVIYCHHHSKGAQGQKKAIDRASGSGVFARDPDAVLDLIELEVTEEIMKQQENKAVCRVCLDFMEKRKAPLDGLCQDDRLMESRLVPFCDNSLDQWQRNALHALLDAERKRVAEMTAWRIEGTLREFPKFEPVNLWFRYPAHYLDASDTLKSIGPDDEMSGLQRMIDIRKKKAEQEKTEMRSQIEVAFEGLEENGVASVVDIAEEIGVSAESIRRWFGKGKRSRPDLKKLFDSYEDQDDRKLYLKRKTAETNVENQKELSRDALD